MADYICKGYQMVSGMGLVSEHMFRMHKGKSGRRWLVSTIEACGGHVYVEGRKGSDGFGGATLEFKLEDGSAIKLKGPWHSNSDALFEDTGVDIRDKHLIFGVIAKSRRYDPKTMRTILEDVIYQDDEPQIGSFDRIRDLAQQMANERGETLQCYSESLGGSWTGPVKPETVEV